jgi:glutamyl-tRNA synthetase
MHAQSAAQVKADLDALSIPADQQEAFWTVARENITTRKDIAGWWDLCLNGADPVIDGEDKDFVAEALVMLPDGPYSDASWSEWTAAVKEATGRKGRGLFMPLRKALTGMNHGPDMGSLMPLLQKIKAKG